MPTTRLHHCLQLLETATEGAMAVAAGCQYKISSVKSKSNKCRFIKRHAESISHEALSRPIQLTGMSHLPTLDGEARHIQFSFKQQPYRETGLKTSAVWVCQHNTTDAKEEVLAIDLRRFGASNKPSKHLHCNLFSTETHHETAFSKTAKRQQKNIEGMPANSIVANLSILCCLWQTYL